MTEKVRIVLELGGMATIVGWYIWYCTVSLPKTIAKMTPEEREALRQCWAEQEKWER